MKLIKFAGAAFLFVCFTGGLLFYGAYQLYWLGNISVGVLPAEPQAAFSLGEDFHVAILHNKAAAKFFEDSRGYAAAAHYWQRYLQSVSIAAEVIGDSELEKGVSGYRVLILPSALCLSEKQRASVRSFLRRGHGVVATWATGARDEACKWKGWEFLRELTEAAEIQSPEWSSPSFVSFVAGQPIAAGLPTGSRAEIAKGERLEAITFSPVEGYWSDFRLFPTASPLPTDLRAAVVRRDFGKGRVVWFGFPESSILKTDPSKDILDSALLNSLAWAGRGVLAAVEPWPYPFSSAVVPILNLSESPENAIYAAETLSRGKAKGAFFCLTGVIEDSPHLLRRLKPAGELGSRGVKYLRFNELSRMSQAIQLLSSSWTLWRETRVWPSGFYPPFELVNRDTLFALAANQMRYYVVGPEGFSVLPSIVRIQQRVGRHQRSWELVRLARVAEDDLRFPHLGAVGFNRDWVVKRLLADFATIHRLGGLHLLIFHTHGLGRPEHSDVLAEVIDELRNRPTWIATGGQVARWWLWRSRLAVQVSQGEGNILKLKVVSEAPESLEGAVLSVYAPMDPDALRLAAIYPTSCSGQVRADVAHGRVQLVLGTLQPGRPCHYEITG